MFSSNWYSKHCTAFKALMVLSVLAFYSSGLPPIVLAQDSLAQSNITTTTVPSRADLETLLSDTDTPMFLRLGVFGGANINLHNAQFSVIPGCPTCNRAIWGSTVGFGWSVGMLAEASAEAFTTNDVLRRFGAALRLSYATHDAPFTQREEVQVPLSLVPTGFASVQHEWQAIISTLGIEPVLTYRPIDYLSIAIGARFGVTLGSGFSYRERSLNDSVLYKLPNGELSSVRNERTGQYPTRAPLLTALTAGFSYEFPMNNTGTVMLAPEVFYQHNLSSLLTNEQWSAHSIRAGLAVKWSPYRTNRPELTPEIQQKLRLLKQLDSALNAERKANIAQKARVDSLNRVITSKLEEFKKFGISVNIAAIVGVDASGKEVPSPTLTVEQFRSSSSQPLAPAVFFDDNSAVLPSRYRRLRASERGNFRLEDLNGKSSVEVYRHVLNIVGKRMTDNPVAVLYLTGCTAGAGAEQTNPKIAEDRAQAVSEYLQDVWKIPAKRIILQKRGLPEHPATASSAGSEALAHAENRRVELSSNVPEILGAVSIDAVRRVVTPPMLRIETSMQSGAGVKQWDVEISQFVGTEAVTLKQFSGTAANAAQTLRWNIADEPTTIPQSGQDLTVQLTMTDVNNRAADAPIVGIAVKQISLEQKTVNNASDKRLDTYDVVGFEGDETVRLDDNASKTLDALRKSLKPGAKMFITGFAETTANDAQTLAIAKARAQAAAKQLGVNDAAIAAQSVPSEAALPEARLYTRRVQILVETPTR